MGRVAIGVDVGGTNLRFGIVSEAGKVIARSRAKSDAHQGVDAVISRIDKGIAGMLKRAERDGHVPAGIGVGVPGIISLPEGVVRFSPNLPGWENFPLRDRLQHHFRLPAIVENDANAYAVGEAWKGAGVGVDSLVCLTLGTGVGGGIILGGEIWRGVDGMAGEVGHMTVMPRGRKCHCGNTGCLEVYASATAVVERAGEALSLGTKSCLVDCFPSGLTAADVKHAADTGDALALRMYRDAGSYLGIAIAGLINLLNVERVVIGGGMAGAWDLFIGPLRAEVARRAFDVPAKRCEIVPGILGDDAGMVGNAGLVFRG
ncbi:MAG: ROK family protein [Nitrospirae bacterium]|nr:ROK family protein [Nitrospirota bacterium]